MVLIAANTNEDPQGTQLRVSKKLTTVCSGRRSRFSKPRPNLAISKRGETNASTAIAKTSDNSKEVIQTSLDSSKDPEVKILNGHTQNQPSIADAEVKILNGHTQNQPSIADADEKEKIVEDVQIISKEESAEILNPEDAESFLDSTIKELSLGEHAKIISNTDVRKSISKENIQLETIIDRSIIKDSDNEYSPEKNSSNAVKDSNIQSSPEKHSSNTVKEGNIQSSPEKNLCSSSKSSESERRGLSSATPTVIDKSKYPHLTSILSKKRTEPRKEVQQKRRRKFKKGDAPPERSKMTMADLIYWNPAKSDECQKNADTVNEAPSVDSIVEENVDDPVENENNILDSVPKLVISEDGEINIDQSSLFVSRNIPQPISTEIVKKDDTTYSSFRKRPLTKHWTPKDTANFYRALSLVGADFSLMEQIFPNRTRRELKQKFKREEKYNIDLINKVLYESQTFDELTLNDFIDQNSTIDDPDEISEKADSVKEKTRKPRTSKKTKPVDNELSECSDLVAEEAENKKPQLKKRRKKKHKKISDDEDVDITGCTDVSVTDTVDNKSNKRKRNAKKLPDDFVSIDSIDDLEFLEDVTSDHDTLENKNSLENTNNVQVENDVGELPSESACSILNKIINGTGNIDSQQDCQENIGNDSLPVVVPNEDVEYVSIECIENDDSNADICMVHNVKAYEVINTFTPPPRKRQRTNSISPMKSHDYFHATKISPTNYTNYTPV